MKKFLCLTLLCCFIIFGAGLAIASDTEVKVPTIQSGNLVVPHSLITTVPDWDKGQVFAAFHDVVGKKSRVSMQRAGNNWIIPGGAGADVHPVVVLNGKDNWTKLEMVWSTGSDFIKFRPAGPCLHVD